MKILSLVHGQSLFEVVVALALCALIIIAVVSLATNSIQNSNFSKNKSVAASYAQEAMEWLRGQKDDDPSDFFGPYVSGQAAGGGYCLSYLPDLSDSDWNPPVVNPVQDCIDKISGTVFTRWVTFQLNGKMVEADVTVSWQDSQGVHEVTNATNFSDPRQL